MPSSDQISVVIPTLQRTDELPELLRLCNDDPSVIEVLVINNAPTPLVSDLPKVRVLEQGGNIFVNPAWNLGAREASGDYLAIINDDVLFDPAVFDYCRTVLRRGRTGIIGAETTYANRTGRDRLRTRFATFSQIWHNFGMFMCMRREDYVPIPDELKIWGGDEWLFVHQQHPNRVVLGAGFLTETNVTSSSAEFQPMRVAENRRTRELVDPLWGSRWWHRASDALSWGRETRSRVRARFRR